MSRRRRTLLFGLVLAVAVIFVCLERSPISPKWQAEPGDVEKYHGTTFTVTRVVDGDTLDINTPDGKYTHTRIRLLGIDTPETKSETPAVCRIGREAADFAKELALGKQLTIYLDEGNPTRGKYGRLLAYVQLPDGRFLNEVLLIEGYAYADLRFRHSLYNKYKQLQAVAQRQKKGLWPNVTRDQLPEWLQRMKPNLLLTR